MNAGALGLGKARVKAMLEVEWEEGRKRAANGILDGKSSSVRIKRGSGVFRDIGE